MKKYLLIISLIIISACSGSENQPEQTISHTYVIAGQSNTCGRAPIPEDLMGHLDGVYLLNGLDEWIPASNPMNIYSNIHWGDDKQKLSYAYSFGRRMKELYPDEDIKIIVNARGGSAIECWLPGNECYDKTLERIGGKDITAVLWHQGESDFDNQFYNDDAVDLINSLRQDLGPDIPFVAGQIAQWRPDWEWFNTNLLDLPNMIDNVAVVSSEGLTGMDRAHFDADSQIILGERYAEKVAEMLF